jgi:hypothetical protein
LSESIHDTTLSLSLTNHHNTLDLLSTTTTTTMPATRSQKAALASPLTTTTRKRSVSRAPSAEPPARKAPAVTTTTTKRKQVAAEGDADEEAQESPKKRARNTLRDREFRERIQKRVEEKRAAREQQAPEEPAQTTPKGPYSYLPTYPTSHHPGNYNEPPVPTAATQSDRQYSWWKPPTTPTQAPAPSQQVAQTQPQQRTWIDRIKDVVTPWRNPKPAPSSVDRRLPDARIDLIQLQEHANLQKRLNSELSQAVAMEEQRLHNETPHHEYEAEQEHTLQAGKRKRTAANEITGLPALNAISESPETRFADNTQTPSRPRTHNGLVPKSLPRPRRTYKEARAAAANKGMRNATDPPTPAVSRTAPSTPYDKNDYARIRRLREIEELASQHNAMKAKLDKLRAEQAAEAATQPRKTKRVKIEHLKEIPHNLPGEPSGSFRLPEIDSDDEMEVDEDVEVIENPFTAADDETPEETQASPAKTPAHTSASNLFTTQPSASISRTPALKATSPIKGAISPVRKAPSPVKKAPSPMKAASPVEEAEEVEEVEDTVIEASPTASPEPTQVFSEASDDDESDIDDEDWPELPQRKDGEPEPPQWWKAEALAKFNKEFVHWEATGEILA